MTDLVMGSCDRNTLSDHSQGVGHAAMQAASQHVAL